LVLRVGAGGCGGRGVVDCYYYPCSREIYICWRRGEVNYM
jgi:hypothetical protein